MSDRFFWVAYDPDPAKFLATAVAFSTELPALRHAVDNGLTASKAMFGKALPDQLFARAEVTPDA